MEQEQIQNQVNEGIDSSQSYLDMMELREGVPAVDLPFDFKNTGRMWEEKYGLTEVPLLVRSASGKLYDDKRLKGIFKDGKYKRIVSRSYVVFPNEEVDEMLKEFVSDAGLEIKKTYTSHYGDAQYWEILDTLSHPKPVAENDDMQFGCIVRNSVGTNIALGADLFTYRLICSNGAIARGHDLGSIAIKHVGDHDRMKEYFRSGIENIVAKSVGLLETYKVATGLKLNAKIAQALADKLPQKVLPESIKVDPKTGDAELLRPQNLWEAFNEVTAASWHSTKTQFLTKKYTSQNVHKILIDAVNGVYTNGGAGAAA